MTREIDQDIPMIRQWVEERVMHYIRTHGKQGEVEVIRHPNPDFEGVQVRVSIKGQSKPAKLDVGQDIVKFDKPEAERQIKRFVLRQPSASEK